jgi:hypothetical protein
MKHLGRLSVHFLSSLLLKHRLALGAVPLALRLRRQALQKFFLFILLAKKFKFIVVDLDPLGSG